MALGPHDGGHDVAVEPRHPGFRRLCTGIADRWDGADPRPRLWGEEARLERIRRCERAVALQREGLSRSAIANELSTNVDSVRRLLRDGRFYENPQADHGRFARGLAAIQARETGESPDAFAVRMGISGKAAKDAWRDASALASLVGNEQDPNVPDLR